MNNLTRRAYGKINLSLDVLGKRSDGYHLVKMVMQTVDIYDTISIRKTAGSDIIVRTDSGEIPAGPDNLVWRAADVMRRQFGIRDGLEICIEKRIPVAAGMAGGSADAAAVFTGMRELFDLRMGDARGRELKPQGQESTPAPADATGESAPAVPEEACSTGINTDYANSALWNAKGNGGTSSAERVTDQFLQALALPLGADIPYCITGGTQLSEGIGEVLTPLPAVPTAGSPEEKNLIIVKPDLYVSTGWVYKAFDSIPPEEIRHPDVDAQVQAIRNGDFHAMAAACGNVLEQKTGAIYPIIGELEQFLLAHGAIQSIMTGSGPTVFGIFDTPDTAAAAFEALEQQPQYASFQKFLTKM